jgi:hypothetical protein
MLLFRAATWCGWAVAASLDEERRFCLAEADRCERRTWLSQSTPVLCDQHAGDAA